MRLDTNYRSKERPLLSRRNQRFGANAIRVPKITKTKTSNHLTRPTSLEMLNNLYSTRLVGFRRTKSASLRELFGLNRQLQKRIQELDNSVALTAKPDVRQVFQARLRVLSASKWTLHQRSRPIFGA